jgi:Ca2+-binding RTX toxin-like protein
VYWDIDTVNHVFTVTWDDVGHYSFVNDVPNAYQLQLIDLGGGDFDIIFRYENINYAAGARAGYSSGNGVNAFEMSQSGDANQMLQLDTTPGNRGVTGVDVFEVRGGHVFQATNDRIDGGTGADTLTGGPGNDVFVFHRGEANGDVITDFNGNGSSAGDELEFIGFGTAAQGATLIQIDAMRWQINSADGTAHEIFQLSNGATLHSTDWHFA